MGASQPRLRKLLNYHSPGNSSVKGRHVHISDIFPCSFTGHWTRLLGGPAASPDVTVPMWSMGKYLAVADISSFEMALIKRVKT